MNACKIVFALYVVSFVLLDCGSGVAKAKLQR